MSACSSTEIDPSSDSEGNHLVCFVSIHSNPTAPLCSGSPGPPLLSPEGAGCCLHVRKGQLNNTDGVYLPDFIMLSVDYLNLLSSRVLATETVHHDTSNINLITLINQRFRLRLVTKQRYRGPESSRDKTVTWRHYKVMHPGSFLGKCSSPVWCVHNFFESHVCWHNLFL